MAHIYSNTTIFTSKIRLILSILIFVTVSGSEDINQITISQGSISGVTLTSRNGNKYSAFHSIPYAKPPVGELRFRTPQEPETWNGVRDGSKKPPLCIQKDYFVGLTEPIVGQEDCLYLNVFTRKLKASAPVIVFIHGGGFAVGYSALHSPEYWMDGEKIVFVSINYRLGLLGFLSSGDKTVPGNNGLKDQTMALKWIQKNIAAFGGNPNNVLIIGHSAGSASVHLHMYSPLSRGLFNKVISLSGVAASWWGLYSVRITSDYFRAVSVLSGCIWSNNSDIVQCLKTVSADELLKIQMKLFTWNTEPTIVFGPTTEPAEVSNAFLYKKPQAGEELDPHNIPWITGVTSAEGIFRAAGYLKNGGTELKELNENYKRLLPIQLYYGFSADRYDTSLNITKYLKDVYFQDRNISLETIKELIEIIGDAYFTMSAANAALKYKGQRYLYYYSYESKRRKNKFSEERLGSFGVDHGEDVINFFESYSRMYQYKNETDIEDTHLSETLIKMYINFAYTGNPNIDENITWKPVEDSSLPYLNIKNDGFAMETKFFKNKYKIWKNIQKFFE